MRQPFNQITALSFLLCGVLSYEVSAENSSQIKSEPQLSLSKSSENTRLQPSVTPAPTEKAKAAPFEQIKADGKPKAVTKQTPHKKKHKPRGAPAKEKTKPLAIETKVPETAAASTLSI